MLSKLRLDHLISAVSTVALTVGVAFATPTQKAYDSCPGIQDPTPTP